MKNIPENTKPIEKESSGGFDRDWDKALFAILNEIDTKTVGCGGETALDKIIKNEGTKGEFCRLSHREIVRNRYERTK